MTALLARDAPRRGSEPAHVSAIVTLSIFLRQRGSLESKPFAGANDRTGTG